MTVKYVVCTHCRQVVARFKDGDLSSPLSGEMFESHLADRGVAPPWAPGLEARYFKCPQCPLRPWAEPEPLGILVSDTIDGQRPYFLPVEVVAPPLPPPPASHHPQEPSTEDVPVEEGFPCQFCGRILKTAQGKVSHERACQGG